MPIMSPFVSLGERPDGERPGNPDGEEVRTHLENLFVLIGKYHCFCGPE